MYIYDRNKSLTENLNTEAMVNAQEEIAEQLRRQNGQVDNSGSEGTSFIGSIFLFIGRLFIIGLLGLGIYLGVIIGWGLLCSFFK